MPTACSRRWVYKYLEKNIPHLSSKDAIEHFRVAFKRLGHPRDCLIMNDDLLKEFIRELGNGWGHIPPNDVRKLLGDITRNPSVFGYHNGEWKMTGSKNHGKNTKKKEEEKQLSAKLTAHYGTQHYAEVKDASRATHGDHCVGCGDPLEQFHHYRGYDDIGTPDEVVVPVCKICHPILDCLRVRDWAGIVEKAKEYKIEQNGK